MRKLIAAFVACLALAQFPTETLAQQGAAWAGWARCEVRVQGPGYNDQQTHTWTITSGAPVLQGAFQVYSGTWAVVGGGSLSRSQGTQTLMAQWAINGPGISAPIAVFVRASDNRMFIQARHAQLRSNSAIQGYQQVTMAGRPQTPGRIDSAAFEWAFPVIAVSAPVAPDRNATAAGSSTSPVNGSVGVMQPAGSQGTASCTWQFGQGSAAPAPPPTLAAQAIPTPGGPTTTTPPANNPPVASTPPGTTTPPDNPPGSPPPLIHVEFPNGGESFTAGSFDSYDVIWTHTFPAGQLFDVDFSLDGGRTWQRYDSNQAGSSSDLILHAHPELQPTTTALVRVSPAGNAAAGDTSDAPFAIVAPASSAPPAVPLTATPLAPALLPLSVFCTLRGPAQSSAYDNYATPGAAHLDWEPVAGVREYTVSRSDLGVVSPRPLPASETSFVHIAMLPHPGTYVYTITANYREGGCGATTITLSAQLPATPYVSYQLETQAGAVRLMWDWSARDYYERLAGDYTGVLITGPALPAAGREVLRRSQSGDHTVINGVLAGSRTWTVKTYWDTPTGRLIDNTGRTITVLVP